MLNLIADEFYKYLDQLDFVDPLPPGIDVLNPMKANKEVRKLLACFIKIL